MTATALAPCGICEQPYQIFHFHPVRVQRTRKKGPLVDKDGNRVPCHADVLLELADG